MQALTPAFIVGVAPELGVQNASARLAPLAAAPLMQPAARTAESATDVLARFGGRRDAAARHLGISRTTLWRKLRAEEGS